MKVATKAEIEKRVNSIFSLLIAGHRREHILQFAAKKNWGCGDRTVDIYIKRAKEAIDATSAVKRTRQIGKQIARFDDLYIRAYAIQDYKTCLAVAKALSDLLGLNEPVRSEVKTTSDEHEKIISKLATLDTPTLIELAYGKTDTTRAARAKKTRKD